jgi:sporulation protein YlmC with PRC-barrel domain
MSQDDARTSGWMGFEVVGSDGERIGVVEAVRYGEGSGTPQWLVVHSSVAVGKKLIIPAEEVRQAGNRLTAPYTAARVVDAPQAADLDSPTEEEKARICRYYGLVYGVDRERPADGCEEMPDNRPAG